MEILFIDMGRLAVRTGVKERVFLFLIFFTFHLFENDNLKRLSSDTQSCPTLCDPMNRSTPGLSVHHHFLEFTQTHVHRVGDATQPSITRLLKRMK